MVIVRKNNWLKNLPWSIILLHSRVDVKAWVPELRDLLGKEFDSFGVLAEDDGLVDVELWEQCVEAMEFFLLLEVGIVLGNTLQGEFIHEINILRVRNILFLEVFDCYWISCGEKWYLSIWWHEIKNFGYNDFKVIWEQLVDFIKNQHITLIEFGNVLTRKIENSSWSGNNNVNWLIESVDILLDLVSTSRNHALDLLVLAKLLNNHTRLHGKLSCRHQNKTLDMVLCHINPFNHRNRVWSSLTCSIFGSRYYISVLQSNWDALFLDRRRILIPLFVDAQLKLLWESKISKGEALGFCDIIGLDPGISFGSFDSCSV